MTANPFLCIKNNYCMFISERSMMSVKKEDESLNFLKKYESFDLLHFISQYFDVNDGHLYFVSAGWESSGL